MRTPSVTQEKLTKPLLQEQAYKLATQLKILSETDIKKIMKVSNSLARRTRQLIDSWTDESEGTMPAADSFLGDIYSGLRYRELSNEAKSRANERLRILSGLYGILRPRDGIYPYRLEMGYRISTKTHRNLYDYWGKTIAQTLPKDSIMINLAPDEYSKAVLPHLPKNTVVISPKFLTYNKEANKPTFVAVHAKIARGSFARWLLEENVLQPQQLSRFNLLGYAYEPDLSKNNQPVFVCQNFQGFGLSIK
jgi:cytoplasmic iron level regulating protein YaaA (DUF328/UPF0246 family)